MSTIVVWVLIFQTWGGPSVIDNIDSQANCERLRSVVRSELQYGGHPEILSRCVAVRKVVQK